MKSGILEPATTKHPGMHAHIHGSNMHAYMHACIRSQHDEMHNLIWVYAKLAATPTLVLAAAVILYAPLHRPTTTGFACAETARAPLKVASVMFLPPRRKVLAPSLANTEKAQEA